MDFAKKDYISAPCALQAVFLVKLWLDRLRLTATLAVGAVLFSTNAPAHAQQASGNALTTQAKAFLEPEAGLNNEIRAALQRLEQTCKYLNNSNKNPSNAQSSPAQLLKEIDNARKLANEQKILVESSLENFKSSKSLQNNSCEALPTVLRLSAQCKQFQQDSEKFNLIASISKSYYDEALGRFASYEAAHALEVRGCTRAGFASKLWAAEQEHIVPKLKNSARTLTQMLN